MLIIFPQVVFTIWEGNICCFPEKCFICPLDVKFISTIIGRNFRTNRRWSMVSPRDGERERLEGLLFPVLSNQITGWCLSGPIGDGAWYHVLVRGKGLKAPSSQSYPIRLQDDVSGPIRYGAWSHLVLVRGKAGGCPLPGLLQSD